MPLRQGAAAQCSSTQDAGRSQTMAFQGHFVAAHSKQVRDVDKERKECMHGLGQLLPQPDFFGYCDRCMSTATSCHALRPTHEKCSVIATIVRRICWPAAP